jgi:type VI secretion system protein ImpK
MNLFRNLSNLSYAIRRVSSATQSLDMQSDALLRAPTLTSLNSAAAQAGTAAPSSSAGEPQGAAHGEFMRDESAPRGTAERSVLQFPTQPGSQRQITTHRSEAAPIVYTGASDKPAVLKAGQQASQWDNPFVSHALAALLTLRNRLAAEPVDQLSLRSQLGLEVRLYRERLAASGATWEETRDASYLLCTYLDECVNDHARQSAQIPYDGERSLLVEFHDDAWGGEDAFADLDRWMKLDHPPLSLLSFYELILSLGWQGRYAVVDRGAILLQDLRSQLHALIWHGAGPGTLGTPLIEPQHRRRRWWTLARAGGIALAAVVLGYAVLSAILDAQGRPLRAALAAWMPPTRSINIADTLPPPLPQLLSEGWLTAYKHPQGWLLVFRSDGAFDVGQATVRKDFEHNIERLGLAFAPWPGDLEVIGHTDARPIHTSAYPSNQALSEARASTVADELRKTALPGGAEAPTNAVPRTIQYSGRGDTQPLDNTKSNAAYEKNRRVDVLWKVLKHGEQRKPQTYDPNSAIGATDANGAPIMAQPVPAAPAPAAQMPDGVEIAPDGATPYASPTGDAQ